MTDHNTTIREAREALSRLDKAGEEIGEVAANVRSRWRMSIPANPNRDTDLIVSDACVSGQRAITALLAVIEQQQDEIAARETGCRCTIETGCGEGRDAGCEWCANADIYDPCPVFGFMCDPECGNPEEPCCTEWQQANTRAFEQRATEIGKLRDERQALRAKVERQAETLRQVRERANDYADAGLARILDADGGDA